MNPILARLGLAALLAALGYLTYRLGSRLIILRRARQGLGLRQYRPGTPAVVLFTSPDCQPCRTLQRPALEHLTEWLDGQLQVIEIDVLEQPDAANQWGVLSLPTTFIIDSSGQPRQVNHGVARETKLVTQLARIGELPEGFDRKRAGALAVEAD